MDLLFVQSGLPGNRCGLNVQNIDFYSWYRLLNCAKIPENSMRITVYTIGSRGDVQPFIALASGLQEAGYDVRMATHGNFQSLAEERNLSFVEVWGNPREILESEDGIAWLESKHNPIEFFRRSYRLMSGKFEEILRDAVRVCDDTDAIVYSPLALGAFHVAEKRSLPGILCLLQPLFSSREFASPLFPPYSFGPLYNVMSHAVAGQLFWQPVRNMTNKWRRSELDLPNLSFLGPLHRIGKRKSDVLMGYSPTVVPKPVDWHNSLHVTGYWFLNRNETWNPPSDLQSFLNSGSQPVYIGFGSMIDREPEKLMEIIREAVALAGVRAILHSGWARLGSESLSDNIFVVDSIPHDWLFPRMRAIVHHGGAGTTGAALRSGVPAIVIPYFGDQYFWAHRVWKLGTSPRPVARKDLTPLNLAKALLEAMGNDNCRKRAAEVASRIRNENGVANAVEIIRKVFQQ